VVFAPGTQLTARYVLDELIGSGGFGAVYRGRQLPANRKVAIKVLHAEQSLDQEVVARFQREAQLLCQLRDAHTVTTYDFDRTPDGTSFIVMELLEGLPLVAAGPQPWPRVVQLMRDACSSLAEAHAMGIVHRDLKPENLFLDGGERLKVLDFGVAKALRGDTGGQPITQLGRAVGTLTYMSPEQISGDPVDARSDLYALGVVGYEALVGRVPYPNARGPAQLLTAQFDPPPPISNVPPELNAVLMRVLSHQPRDRFQSAAELSAALAAVPTIAKPRRQAPLDTRMVLIGAVLLIALGIAIGLIAS